MPSGDPGRAGTGRREAEDDVADRRLGVGPRERRGAGGVDVDHGEIAVGIDAEDGATRRSSVAEGHGDLVAPEVVGVGQDAAVTDDDAAAAHAAADPDHCRPGAVMNGADGAGKIVEDGHRALVLQIVGPIDWRNDPG